jgi:hypothetical protein
MRSFVSVFKYPSNLGTRAKIGPTTAIYAVQPREVVKRQGREEVVADGGLLDSRHARFPGYWRERAPLSAVHSRWNGRCWTSGACRTGGQGRSKNVPAAARIADAMLTRWFASGADQRRALLLLGRVTRKGAFCWHQAGMARGPADRLIQPLILVVGHGLELRGERTPGKGWDPKQTGIGLSRPLGCGSTPWQACSRGRSCPGEQPTCTWDRGSADTPSAILKVICQQ